MAKLEQLETEIIVKAIKAGARAAGGVIVRQAKKTAQSRTGRLKKTIGQSVKLDKVRGIVFARIGQVKKKREKWGAMHIHIVEKPTRPHIIPNAFGRGIEVRHPGTRGQYFLRNSWAQKSAKAAQAFERTIVKHINKVAAQTGPVRI